MSSSLLSDTALRQSSLAEVDPEIAASIVQETGRLQSHLELIASENVVSRAVLEAVGSILTNKYAEGYPGKRYYGGCEYVDVAENLARERALALFPGSEHVNVQPHSGAQANAAACLALLQPGDTILNHLWYLAVTGILLIDDAAGAVYTADEGVKAKYGIAAVSPVGPAGNSPPHPSNGWPGLSKLSGCLPY